MTGFSRAEGNDKGIKTTVEVKSLNGRYLEISCKTPRNLNHKEIEIKELVKNTLSRGTVNVNINVEYNGGSNQISINEKMFEDCYKSLCNIKSNLKFRDTIKIEHILAFSSNFLQKEENDTTDAEWNLIRNVLKNAIKYLDKMRLSEGQRLHKDITTRMKKITIDLEKIEAIGIKRVPEERERLRQRVAQLFESDEIDEHRIQMELVLLADKLDISEECTRLRSHIKFFNDTLKLNEPVGRKITFLLQEMNREVNTIGSKINDAEASQFVVNMKDELECIREQAQNIE